MKHLKEKFQKESEAKDMGCVASTKTLKESDLNFIAKHTRYENESIS